MKSKKEYSNKLLKMIVQEYENNISIIWIGKSIDREPSKFITPILMEAVKMSGEMSKKLILDFRKLLYMNSSTITPVIKVLERAKRGKTSITVYYDKYLNWQDISFSALTIFKTKDHRVDIKGL